MLGSSDATVALDALALYQKLWLERADPLTDPGLVELQARVAAGT
jgi:hypothetical protein